MLNTDFWWLSPEEAKRYRYMDLFHQEPYSDEPNTNKGPLSCPMSQSKRRYSFEFISQWKAKFRNINTFRSFALYSTDTDGEKIIGPFLLDIDRAFKKDGGYLVNLGKALEDTRSLIKEYCSNLKDEDYRILFTGHKGFHIEIHPRVISMPPNVDRWQHFNNKRKEINNRFGNDFVDKFHFHVRLHNSINSWTDYFGQRIYSMNFEVSTNELFSLSVEDISARAKDLAFRALES